MEVIAPAASQHVLWHLRFCRLACSGSRHCNDIYVGHSDALSNFITDLQKLIHMKVSCRPANGIYEVTPMYCDSLHDYSQPLSLH